MIELMMFKTFTDLANSPLSEEDEDLEKILLEFAVKFGTTKIGIRDIKKILSLVHEVHHTMNDSREEPLEISIAYPSRQIGKSSANSITSIWRYQVPSLIAKSTISTPSLKKPQPFSLPTISDLPNLSYPSDAVIKNVFRIMFETDAWDHLVLDDRLEKHVSILRTNASSHINKVSDDPDEKWRKNYDHRMGDLLEIWSEMLDKIAEKRMKLLKIMKKEKS